MEDRILSEALYNDRHFKENLLGTNFSFLGLSHVRIELTKDPLD